MSAQNVVVSASETGRTRRRSTRSSRRARAAHNARALHGGRHKRARVTHLLGRPVLAEVARSRCRDVEQRGLELVEVLLADRDRDFVDVVGCDAMFWRVACL